MFIIDNIHNYDASSRVPAPPPATQEPHKTAPNPPPYFDAHTDSAPLAPRAIEQIQSHHRLRVQQIIDLLKMQLSPQTNNFPDPPQKSVAQLVKQRSPRTND
jgi:hypothetical protein